MKQLLDYLTKRQYTISSCESLTGGLFASRFIEQPGASRVFSGGLVTYQTKVKAKLLGLTVEDIENHGVISEWTAKMMAIKTKEIMNVDVCVSFTGNAGPEMMENQPVGTVYIGYAIKTSCFVRLYHFKGNRNQIREQCIETACQTLMQLIEEVNHG